MGTQIILGFPRLMSEAAGTAGWILVIYLSSLALLMFTLVSRLYRKFEGHDLLDVGEYTAGAVGRFFIGILMLLYLFFICTLVLREFAEEMKVIILPQTPVSVVTMFFLSGMTLGAYKGIEAIVRFSAIIVPMIIIGFFTITLAITPYFEVYNLLPILGKGVNEIFGRGVFKISIFSAISILYLIYPYIRTHKNFNSIGYTSLGLISIFFLWATLSYSLVFPYPAAIEKFLPVYEQARLINYGRFFQRIESMFVFIWAASALLYLSGVFFLILNVFKKTFKLEYYHPLILPFAIILFTLSLWPPNLVTSVTLETNVFRNYAWIITIFIPILLLVIANLKKRRSKGGSKG
jgi:spore germination protein (amino acid permease)